MGQYFKLVNADRKEFVSLPGGMKLIERLTTPVAMGMVGFLLFEGPLDGTVATYRVDPDDPRLEEAIESFRQREIGYELEYSTDPECWERYLERAQTQARPYVTDEEIEAEAARQMFKWSRSSYRDRDVDDFELEWDEGAMSASAAAGFQLDEWFDYCGRWAGDDVRLVGDYAESDLYGASQEQWVYEYEGEEFTSYATVSAPIVPSSIEREDIEHTTESQDVEPGDLARVRHPDLDEKVYAHYVRVADQEWTDITDGLKREFVEIVGEEWVEDHCSGLLRPDAVIGV